jgi:hypothetical protein
VNKTHVVDQQRTNQDKIRDGIESNFAYNEVPTIAVAIDCWFRARQQLTRPFLCQ